MASRLDNALAVLGLNGVEELPGLWQNYVERLGVLQDALIAADTDAARYDAQTRLATLVASYQFLRTLTDTPQAVDRNAVTLLRMEEEAAPIEAPVREIVPGMVLLNRYEIGAVLGDGGMGCV